MRHAAFALLIAASLAGLGACDFVRFPGDGGPPPTLPEPAPEIPEGAPGPPPPGFGEPEETSPTEPVTEDTPPPGRDGA